MTLSGGPAWPGAAGGRVEVPGFGDAAPAGGLGLVVPGDAEPVARTAPRVELGGLDPVVDDAGAAAEAAGGLGDADLAGRIRRRGRDGLPGPRSARRWRRCASRSRSGPWPGRVRAAR